MIKSVIETVWREMPHFIRQRIIRLTQNKFTVSVAAIITNEKMEVLLLDHVLHLRFGWRFPGGFMKSGEQAEESLKREIREETCLELENIKILKVRTINRHIEMLFTAAAKGEAKVNSQEIKSLGWFRVEEMPENMSEAQKAVVRKILMSE